MKKKEIEDEEVMQEDEPKEMDKQELKDDDALSRGVAAEEGEEVRESRGFKAPQRVSKQERDDHEKLHMPYRAWCRACVRGRGRNMPHMTKKDGDED